MQVSDQKKSYFSLIKQLLLSMLVFATIFFVISTVMVPRYQAVSSILLLKKETSGQMAYWDPSQSALNFLVLKNTLRSNSFLDTLAGQNNLVKELYSGDHSEKRLAQWKKDLELQAVENTGIVSLEYTARSKAEAKEILSAVLELLKKDGRNFYGHDLIEIRTVDKPYYLSQPIAPKLWLNTVIGGLIGLVIGAYLVVSGRDKIFNFSPKPATEEQEIEVKSTEPEIKEEEEEQEEKMITPTASVQPQKKIDLLRTGISTPPETVVTESAEPEEFVKPVKKEKEAVPEKAVAENEAPENLPIFQDDKSAPSTEAATEEEIKARLNKLLKGEL